MTTTPPPGSLDPVLQLLRELRDREEARDKDWEALRASVLRLEKSDEEQKLTHRRTEHAISEVQAALAQQDARLGALDQRVAGNHEGVRGALGIVGDTIETYNAHLQNVEGAVLEVGRTTRMLHGRLIDESSSLRKNAAEQDRELVELDGRVTAVESGVSALVLQVGKTEPPEVESVEATEG